MRSGYSISSASALEATTNGAQARIQLELVLIKAAAPEMDPSTTALLSRIERLETALREGGGGLRAVQNAVPSPAPAVAPAASSSRRAGLPTGTARRRDASPWARARQVRSAPRPSAEPAAVTQAAPAPQSPPTLASVVDLWPAVVDIVRGENAMLAALLADARPVGCSDRELTLAFPPGAAFLKRKAEQDDHRRVTADAFRTLTGQMLALRYELREPEELQEEPAGAPTPLRRGTRATLSGGVRRGRARRRRP